MRRAFRILPRACHSLRVRPPALSPRIQVTRFASTRSLRPRRVRRHLRNALFALTVLSVLYYTYSPFRHTVLAAVRCTRLMKAVMLDIIDYKQLFAGEGAMGQNLSPEELQAKRQARKDCHRRSATRLLEALKKNSGIYVKLGQHVAAVQVLPLEWTQTMRPLQDQCFPTPTDEIDEMLRTDLGLGIHDLFEDFHPDPIGVASLAQVHRAIDKRSGRPVAVKVQHADLQEFAQVDMVTVNFAIDVVRYIFPEFEFSWLGEEMKEMLPLEMDFRHEAYNSNRCRSEFEHLRGKTSLYLPEVLWAERRCMVMEFIEGSRIDDLSYLKDHHIDRNQVSQELSRIFSQMVYLNGHFHADPHLGNLLIRPKGRNSYSPFNFDVCLLDHGQYFDIPDDLRVNYAHFWLSLMSRGEKNRKKYAKLVGNIDDDMYPILESAITGQISTTGGSLLGSEHDLSKLRSAMMEREGLVADIFELLRRVPRRLLMILKLSDLQRALDMSLATTHGQSRIFIIVARYCADAIWEASKMDFRQRGISALGTLTSSFFTYTYWSVVLGITERVMDMRASWIKVGLWVHGLSRGGLAKARDEMAGLIH